MQRRALREKAARYVGAAALGHLLWEIAQLPLYVLWQAGTWRQIAFAAIHCIFGDILITMAALALAASLAWLAGWRPFGLRMAVTAIAFGVAYTVFSEWLNVTVRSSWAYSPAMPVLPPFGTGLAPLLQWLVVPSFAWRVACRPLPIRR